MYNFIDVNEVSESAVLPSEALQINGEYIENLIPGYRTLSVSGREALSLEIKSYETGARDGATMQYKRYPARTIIVQYQLIAESNEAFRAAYNALTHVLDVEDATLIFNDENDKFFTGTPSAIGEVEPGRNAVIGEFEIFCADPFKYSVQEYEAEPTTDGDFVVEYNGTYKSFPKLVTEFYNENETSEDGETVKTLTGVGDCGYVAFFNENEKIIQLGNPEEVDGETLYPSQTLIHYEFRKSTSWGTAGKQLWKLNNGILSAPTHAQVGNVGLALPESWYDGNLYYIKASNYGTGDGWHGPTLSRDVPADQAGEVGAANFLMFAAIKMCIGNNSLGTKEIGAMQIIFTDANDRIVTGINIFKGSNGKKASLRFYVNNKTKETIEMDLSYHNKYLGTDNPSKRLYTSRECAIKKEGAKISFDIGGIKKNYVENEISETKVTKVTIAFLAHGTKRPLSYNGMYYFNFIKHNCNTWRNVQNKFGAGDIITADCSTGEIIMNNLHRPEYGALGNDWEEFYLKPGTNQIGVSYSDWVAAEYAPNFKMRYREVFL